MRAVVYQGVNKPLALTERVMPSAGPSELILRVKACGICGSDIHAAETEFVPEGTVMGHEFCGEVFEVGAEVEGWQVGDRAVGVPLWYCGKCEHCKSGNQFSCPDMKYIGLQDDVDGAFAEYVRIPVSNALKFDPKISSDHAALWEPLAVGFKAFKRGHVRPEDSILIVGGGAIGLSIALIAKSLGVQHIGLSEMQPERLERAAKCGANVVIDAKVEEDPVAAFTRETGKVPRVIFECVGLPGMYQRMIDMAPKDAHLVLVGVCMVPEEFSVISASFKQLTCSFSIAYEQAEIDYVLEALALGAINPEPLISKRTGFHAFSETFEYLKKPNSECKVLFSPEHD